MEPIQVMYEGDLAPLIEWAENGDRDRDGLGFAPEPFYSWVRNHMPPYCRGFVTNTIGYITENGIFDGDWVKGYPHIHTTTMFWEPEIYTIITYLIVPEEGGEFAMGGLERNDPYTLIPVKPGLSIGCDSITWHGVKQVRKGKRVAIVTAGFPSQEYQKKCLALRNENKGRLRERLMRPVC